MDDLARHHRVPDPLTAEGSPRRSPDLIPTGRCRKMDLVRKPSGGCWVRHQPSKENLPHREHFKLPSTSSSLPDWTSRPHLGRRAGHLSARSLLRRQTVDSLLHIPVGINPRRLMISPSSRARPTSSRLRRQKVRNSAKATAHLRAPPGHRPLSHYRKQLHDAPTSSRESRDASAPPAHQPSTRKGLVYF